MTLHCLNEAPPAWLGEALERFERQFHYPLGPERRFRISHGRAYLPFFQAMGKASVLVAERGGEVLGTLARVERWIEQRAAAPARRLAHYLCDLKVAPQARGGSVLPRLLRETRRQIEQSGSRACYAVAMGGTGRLPADYTGRLGIPRFEKLAEIRVLRLSTAVAGDHVFSDSAGFPLARPSLRVTGGGRHHRSLMEPVSLLTQGGAGGVLEDTRRGKCLWLEDGGELVSAHLSGLRFESLADGAALLQQARQAAVAAGFPALFFSVPSALWPPLRQALGGEIEEASAVVYGHDLPSGWDWWVDTAEI